MSRITLRVGDTFTIAGVYTPDQRWWPRLKAALLRRPPPMTDELKQFVVARDTIVIPHGIVPVKEL